ncbi:hypothetical protein ABPG77_008872 [Micractinium sp. CCAP 211/92]
MLPPRRVGYASPSSPPPSLDIIATGVVGSESKRLVWQRFEQQTRENLVPSLSLRPGSRAEVMLLGGRRAAEPGKPASKEAGLAGRLVWPWERPWLALQTCLALNAL